MNDFMDTHQACREAIYGDTELSPELAAHFAQCEVCRQLKRRLDRIDQFIGEIPVPEPQPGLLEEILRGTSGAER